MLAEFGIVIRQGIGHIAKRLPENLEDGKNALPGMMRELLQRLGDAKSFKNARQVPAWLGMVPRHEGTGGNVKMGGISKRATCICARC